MKTKKKNSFDIFMDRQTDENFEKLRDFFKEFNSCCLLNKTDKIKMRKDFENAILYYDHKHLSVGKILELLSLKNLGGFYARPAQSWFPLDDAAKIYPVSMEHGVMSVFRLSVNLKEEVVPGEAVVAEEPTAESVAEAVEAAKVEEAAKAEEAKKETAE